MMQFLSNPGEASRYYRRGAIMGLTVAETFILLVFALLLILLLLGNELHQEEEREPDPIVDAKVEELLVVVQALPDEERLYLIEFLAGTGLESRLEELREFEELHTSSAGRGLTRHLVGLSPSQLLELNEWMQSSDFNEVFRQRDHLAEIMEAGHELQHVSELLESQAGLESRLEELREFEELHTSSAGRGLTRHLVGLSPSQLLELNEWMQSSDFNEVFRQRDHLAEIMEAGHELQHVSELLESQAGLESRLEELREFEELHTSSAGRGLTRHLVGLSPSQLLELNEWMQSSDFNEVFRQRDHLAEIMEAGHELQHVSELLESQAGLESRLEELREFEELHTSSAGRGLTRHLVGLSPSQLLELKEWMQSSGFNEVFRQRDQLAEIMEAGHELQHVSELLESQLLVSTAVANDVRQEVGEIVETYGGRIGTDGVISLPTSGSFAVNRSVPTTEFKSFLDDFCPKLLQSMQQHKHSDHIEIIRVEGHASSEWRTSNSERERFLNNLDLSQRRAYAVLAYCLDTLVEPGLFEWATKKITAVGFSSARPVLNEDMTENKEESRRVAFSYIVNYEPLK